MSGLLKGISGPILGQEYELHEQEYIIGRGSAAQIIIPDPGVSRKHARLIPVGDSYFIEDLRSFNGTYVNGNKIQKQQLNDGDEIRISRAVFKYELNEVVIPSQEVVLLDDAKSNVSVVGAIDATQILSIWNEDSSISIKNMDSFTRKLRAFCAVSEALASTLQINELFDKVLEQIMKIFPQGERAAVLLVNEKSGKLEVKAVKYNNAKMPNFFGDGIAIPQTLIHQVMKQGQAIIAQPLSPFEITPDKPLSRMGAPLIFQGEIKGLFHIDSYNNPKAFNESDLDLLTSIAAQTAMALQISEMHEKILKQQSLEKDLQFARKIQRGFLPQKAPNFSGVEFAVHYDPANAVGGDFYDFIQIDSDHLGIVIGDVSGHGISAALFMAKLSSDIRSLVLSILEPTNVIVKANQFISDNQDGMFATVFYCVLNKKQNILKFINAGHNPSFLKRKTGEVYCFNETINLALGVVADTTPVEETFYLQNGDTFVLYTDGIVEAKNSLGEEFGIEKLQHAIQKSGFNSSEIIQGILQELDMHLGSEQPEDDITIISFTVQF